MNGTRGGAVLVGDELGLPQLARVVPPGSVAGLVVAAIRPDSWSVAEQISRRLEVPLLVQPRQGADECPAFLEGLSRLGPEVMFVNSYSMLVPESVLAIFDRAVNLHAALLPEYRGANPIQWALLNDERETGVTMHVMTAEFDAGDVLDVQRVPIRFEDTWLDVRERLMGAADALLARQVPKILAGRVSGTPQDPKAARSHPRRRPEDGLIDWSEPVLKSYNLIRALVAPHPGAFFVSEGEETRFTEWLPIAEVAQMKAQALGGKIPCDGASTQGFESPAEGTRLQRLSQMRFILAPAGSPEVRVTLRSIDWDRRLAAAKVSQVQGGASGANSIRRLANAFARREFSLELNWSDS